MATCTASAWSPALKSCSPATGAGSRRLGSFSCGKCRAPAKGVVFITIEDETGIANLVIWSKLYERQRRVILSAPMMAAHGRVQREGEVVHLVAHRVSDLSDTLASVGQRDAAFPLPHGRGDQLRHGGTGQDPRELPSKDLGARDIHIPNLTIDTIKLKTREFR